MRLICGIFQLDHSRASEEIIGAMVAQMNVPRLVPSVHLWGDGRVILAALDFSAQGKAASPLPEQEMSIMAADVRLDQLGELRQALGTAAASSEDGLLLAALEKYGPTGLHRVLGDFAFACWNRNTLRLTCGRDAFGIRPFSYVYQPGKLFAFASLPKALHGSGIIPKKIDEDALAGHMARTFRSDDSIVAGIKRLPPAHFLEVSREGILVARYWQPNRATVGLRECSPEQAAKEVRRLVDEAVRCRLPRTGDIGAHLSGGLDSSAIAVLAARALREKDRNLHAYSFLDRERTEMILEGETEFVKAVLKQEGNIDWTPIRPPDALPPPAGKRLTSTRSRF